jgi:UDP-N-acetyl-D-galactosamine dehydrogenase
MSHHGRRVSVIGLGYVGLPVAVAFGRAGRVIAFDIKPQRIAELLAGTDGTREVSEADLAAADLCLTTDPADLRQADFHVVAVPTPITRSRRPDLGPLLAASRTVGGQLKPGDIVVYESTVYPGATEEDCVPVLERVSGLRSGRDFHVGYSPERINPGDRQHRFETITKVVSGQDAATLDVIARVYGSVVTAGVFRAASIRTAEAAKVIENTQRDLNIALMNELAVIFERMGIDTRDVLAAAATKWNFLPFTPGLVGGHCIGVDPYYLTYRAEEAGYHPEVILAGRRINDSMGQWLARGTLRRLMAGGARTPYTVTVLGVTFKEDIPDHRNSKVVDIVGELAAYGVRVQVADPMADADAVAETHDVRLVAADALAPADAVILAVPHRCYREDGWPGIHRLLRDGSGLVVDVRACLPREAAPAGVELWRI